MLSDNTDIIAPSSANKASHFCGIKRTRRKFEKLEEQKVADLQCENMGAQNLYFASKTSPKISDFNPKFSTSTKKFREAKV